MSHHYFNALSLLSRTIVFCDQMYDRLVDIYLVVIVGGVRSRALSNSNSFLIIIEIGLVHGCYWCGLVVINNC